MLNVADGDAATPLLVQHAMSIGDKLRCAFRMKNVTHRDAREDWRRFDAAAIPTKESTPHLDRFLADVAATAAGQPPLALLDVGCGDGRLTKRLHDRGFSVTGVDVSPAAVRAAQALAATIDETGRPLRFHVADMAADDPPRLDAAPFDVVVCQLVLSIIGDERHRRNLLRHARSNLVPGGWLYLSASGVSDAINRQPAAIASNIDQESTKG